MKQIIKRHAWDAEALETATVPIFPRKQHRASMISCWKMDGKVSSSFLLQGFSLANISRDLNGWKRKRTFI